MNPYWNDFIVTGQVVLPPLMWLGTGSTEVFIVVFLCMIVFGTIAMAANTIPDGLEDINQAHSDTDDHEHRKDPPARE